MNGYFTYSLKDGKTVVFEKFDGHPLDYALRLIGLSWPNYKDVPPAFHHNFEPYKSYVGQRIYYVYSVKYRTVKSMIVRGSFLDYVLIKSGAFGLSREEAIRSISKFSNYLKQKSEIWLEIERVSALYDKIVFTE